jgi:hypothetical protein
MHIFKPGEHFAFLNKSAIFMFALTLIEGGGEGKNKDKKGYQPIYFEF